MASFASGALSADQVTLQLAEELFAASRVIGDSGQLRALLSDPESADKEAVVSAVFGSLPVVVPMVMNSALLVAGCRSRERGQRWSSPLAARRMSASTISRTRSRKAVVWVQPSFSRALLGSPSSRSTSVGRK